LRHGCGADTGIFRTRPLENLIEKLGELILGLGVSLRSEELHELLERGLIGPEGCATRERRAAEWTFRWTLTLGILLSLLGLEHCHLLGSHWNEPLPEMSS
jgi:hypothetical protein